MAAKAKSTKLKRLIIIFGSKGGIGKTAYARFLLMPPLLPKIIIKRFNLVDFALAAMIINYLSRK